MKMSHFGLVVLLLAGFVGMPVGAAVILDSGPAGSPFIIGASGWNTAAQKFTVSQNLTNVSIEMFWSRPGNDVIFV